MDSHDQEAVAAVRAVFDQVIADGLAPESVTGATDEQVEAYAAAQGVTAVPAAVREVLRLIGVDHGLWQVGGSFGVDAVGRDAKRYAQAALAQDGGAIRDPGGLLVLVMHQGYAFHVIDGADLGHPDPPVWLITEEAGATRLALRHPLVRQHGPGRRCLPHALGSHGRAGWLDAALGAAPASERHRTSPLNAGRDVPDGAGRPVSSSVVLLVSGARASETHRTEVVDPPQFAML